MGGEGGGEVIDYSESWSWRVSKIKTLTQQPDSGPLILWDLTNPNPTSEIPSPKIGACICGSVLIHQEGEGDSPTMLPYYLSHKSYS